MRHRIRHLAHALHQPLDPVEHGVQVLGQRVEFVMRIAQGHAARQVAFDDLGAGAVDLVETRQHVAAHQRAADQAEQQHQPHRPGQRGGEEALRQVALVHVLRHQQVEAAGQREDAAARLARLELVLDPALIVEIDEAVRLLAIAGPGIEIADDRLLVAVGEEIEARPAMRRAADHHIGEAAQAELLVLLGEAGDLGLDDLVGLRVERPLGVPIGEGDQRRHRNGEDRDIDQNDAIRLRA